jgi:hypothetical protein
LKIVDPISGRFFKQMFSRFAHLAMTIALRIHCLAVIWQVSFLAVMQLHFAKLIANVLQTN